MNDETSLSVSHSLVVERVTKATLSQFSGVLRAAARALEQRGQLLWSQGELEPEKLSNAYSDCDIYLGIQEKEAVAGMILLEDDPVFWPHVRPGDSLFIHKLTVAPSFQGAGVATQMLQFAYTEAYRQRKRYLRLDTAAERPKLRAFYEKHGFSCIGERTVGRFGVALYEQEVNG